MGVRKRNTAVKLKEARKNVAFAKLNNCPTSPRKMRLSKSIFLLPSKKFIEFFFHSLSSMQKKLQAD